MRPTAALALILALPLVSHASTEELVEAAMYAEEVVALPAAEFELSPAWLCDDRAEAPDGAGHHPVRKGVIGLRDLIAYFENKGLSDVAGAHDHYGGYHACRRMLSRVGRWIQALGGQAPDVRRDCGPAAGARTSLEEARYLYSPHWGWIDIWHVLSAARITILSGPRAALAFGEMKEDRDPSSDRSYEDLISNLVGAHFITWMRSGEERPKEFRVAFQTYLRGLGFVDNPAEVAPNMADLRAQGDPALHGKYVPRFTLPDAGELTRISRELIQFRAELGRAP